MYDSPSTNILLLGIEDPSLKALTAILARQNHSVCSIPALPPAQALDLAGWLRTGVICCAAQPRLYHPLIEGIRARGTGLPVVAVSSSTDVDEWLDAIQAGVWDYVSAPLEPDHVNYVVRNALRCAAPCI